MDLPASVAALGEQLGSAGEMMPDPALFHDADVFAAERERIFARPWMAVDHATRLGEDGRYFRFDAATRSVLITRDGSGMHALRNVCIHAGYPVCDAEEGAAERLVCPYHGWEFTLDGRLVEPNLSSRIDPSRLRMTSYRVCVREGLILVDLSDGPPSDGIGEPIPAWLSDARVTQRSRYTTTWNWKFVLRFLQCHPNLFFDEPREGGDDDCCIEFGPLSWLIERSQQVALLRVIPKSAERTDFQLIRMTAPEAPEATTSAATADPVGDALRNAGEANPTNWSSRLDPRFFGWYWPLMSSA